MNKHISFRSAELLKEFNKKNLYFFTIQDATELLIDSNYVAVRKLLSDMVNRGLLIRIKDGKYNIVPFERESESYFPNWHLTAEALVKPMEYYIGFYSALDIHSLVTQPSLVEQIVTIKQFVPRIQMIKNVRFEFITYKEDRFFGFEKTWIDDFNKVNCSDLEKTIIDCLYKPKYASGIIEISKSIYKVKDKINQDKMVTYLDNFNSQAVLKRLGFILFSLGILKLLRRSIESKLSQSYVLLDPSSPYEGKHHSKWKVLDNVGVQDILDSIET